MGATDRDIAQAKDFIAPPGYQRHRPETTLAIAWSDRCVLFIATRATAQGRAGVGLRRDAPAFLGARRRFTCLNDERVGPAPPYGGLDLPSPARFRLAPTPLLRT